MNKNISPIKTIFNPSSKTNSVNQVVRKIFPELGKMFFHSTNSLYAKNIVLLRNQEGKQGKNETWEKNRPYVVIAKIGEKYLCAPLTSKGIKGYYISSNAETGLNVDSRPLFEQMKSVSANDMIVIGKLNDVKLEISANKQALEVFTPNPKSEMQGSLIQVTPSSGAPAYLGIVLSDSEKNSPIFTVSPVVSTLKEDLGKAVPLKIATDLLVKAGLDPTKKYDLLLDEVYRVSKEEVIPMDQKIDKNIIHKSYEMISDSIYKSLIH